MANLQGFDANTVEPADDLEPIPAGKYVAVVTDSEVKPTKAGKRTSSLASNQKFRVRFLVGLLPIIAVTLAAGIIPLV